MFLQSASMQMISFISPGEIENNKVSLRICVDHMATCAIAYLNEHVWSIVFKLHCSCT